jgi:hypothetical protein
MVFIPLSFLIMDTRTELLKEIDQFLSSNPSITPTRLGLEVANDGHLVRRLRSGRDITLSKADAIRVYIAKNSTKPEHTAA